MLRNVAEVLDPRWVHITHDDVMNFNKNETCRSAGLSRSELYAYSVNTTVDLVREIMPNAQIMIWADMILPGHHEAWLEGTAAAPANGVPAVWSLVPHDITWCAYRRTNLLPGLWLFALSSFTGLGSAGFESYTGGPGGSGYEQSYIWMRDAFDEGGKGFIGRPGTDAGFDDPAWLWLPAAAEHAWSFFVPENPNEPHYTYQDLNASYGSF
jgi:hypothetical protein